MKRCENCRVLLPDNQKNCPLCHRSLPGGPEETVLPNPDFPAYPQVQLKKFRAVFFRIALFLSAAAGIVTLFINWMTWEQAPRLWSLFVIIPLLYLWLLVVTFRLEWRRATTAATTSIHCISWPPNRRL